MRAGVGIWMLALILLGSCAREEKLRPASEPAVVERPAHFPPPHYNFDDNIYSRQGFELGRRLFYDPLLSVNSTISCSGCHKQADAFSDRGKAFSTGIYGRTAVRNSPVIFNMAWNTSFMWDGGVNHLEVTSLAPLTNPNEMGEDMRNIVHKLNNHNEYPELFRQAFYMDTIDDRQIFWALAQFMSTLVSANSKYDKYVTGTVELSQQELRGLKLFRTYCESCHKEPLFTDYSFQNNGIDSIFKDQGRFRVTRNINDIGKFKVPTLRNIILTYPYMHDGRFNTIEEVLEHYATGIIYSPTLSPSLNGNNGGLQLSDVEKQDIIAFLLTLTDTEMLNNDDLN